jgi:hypothetical protein
MSSLGDRASNPNYRIAIGALMYVKAALGREGSEDETAEAQGWELGASQALLLAIK